MAGYCDESPMHMSFHQSFQKYEREGRQGRASCPQEFTNSFCCTSRHHSGHITILDGSQNNLLNNVYACLVILMVLLICFVSVYNCCSKGLFLVSSIQSLKVLTSLIYLGCFSLRFSFLPFLSGHLGKKSLKKKIL